jgi:hypothetical protein
MQSGTPRPAERRHRATDGSSRASGERGNAGEALLAREALKSSIVDAALDSVVTIDADGRVVEFNRAAERTFGHAREDVLGREMCELIIPPELRDAHRRGLAMRLPPAKTDCSASDLSSPVCGPTGQGSRSSSRSHARTMPAPRCSRGGCETSASASAATRSANACSDRPC